WATFGGGCSRIGWSILCSIPTDTGGISKPLTSKCGRSRRAANGRGALQSSPMGAAPRRASSEPKTWYVHVTQRPSALLNRGGAGAANTFQQAVSLHAQGRLWEAGQLYDTVLKSEDRHFDAVYRLGLIRLQ